MGDHKSGWRVLDAEGIEADVGRRLKEGMRLTWFVRQVSTREWQMSGDSIAAPPLTKSASITTSPPAANRICGGQET